MDKFEEMVDVLDQLADMLAAVKDQGDKAIESTIDRIATVHCRAMTMKLRKFLM